MKDADFKGLPHRVGELRIASLGTEVCEGYKPDITVMDENNKLVLVLECEQKTDRKAFLGNLVKAEKYAEECHANPSLVIVMQRFDNTTVEQIGRHLSPYVGWLNTLKNGRLSLVRVAIISDIEYLKSIKENELICSPEFLNRAFVIAP